MKVRYLGKLYEVIRQPAKVGGVLIGFWELKRRGETLTLSADVPLTIIEEGGD